jgi:hypothetical protein
MTWCALLAIIREESGPDLAARIEARAKRELGGLRITVGAKAPLTVADIDAVAPGRPQEAARILGVSVVTAYRALRRPVIR